MRRLLALVIVGCLCAAACGGGSHSDEHAKKVSPAPAPPTPDTTPIRDLRTPAGVALRPEATSATTPSVSAAPGTALTVTPAAP